MGPQKHVVPTKNGTQPKHHSTKTPEKDPQMCKNSMTIEYMKYLWIYYLLIKLSQPREQPKQGTQKFGRHYTLFMKKNYHYIL